MRCNLGDRTYCSESDCSGCQTYETSISGMRLVNGISIVMAELMHNFGDSVMVAFGEGGPDGCFKTVNVLRQLCFTHTNHTHARSSPW
jgi:hypothetical protein